MNIRDLPIPQSRQEKFLNAKCRNNNTDLPDPKSRIEMFLKFLCEKDIDYFSDVILTNSEFNNSYLSSNINGTVNRIFGVRSLSSDLFKDGYVECIRIYIQTKGTGDCIDNIKIWSVNKTDSIENDTISQCLGTIKCDVQENNNGDYYIDIPIKKVFESDTYFIYHLPSFKTYKFKALTQINKEYQNDYINMDTANLEVGGNVSNNKNYSIYVEIIGNSSLKDELNRIKFSISSYEISQNRLLLTNRYSTDTVGFNVSTATLSVDDEEQYNYDNDLYRLILDNILVGKDNYNRDYMESLINFYWMTFVISDEMYFTLSSIIEEQYTEQEDITMEEPPTE